MLSPPRSSKVYISFVTTSDVSPRVRANTPRLLEDRRHPLVHAVQPGDAPGRVDDVGVAPLVLADQVPCAADRLQVGHATLLRPSLLWAVAAASSSALRSTVAMMCSTMSPPPIVWSVRPA